MTVLEQLRSKANSLPESPGVYIMKDSCGKIIYVGKSKKLKNRVTSYFSGTHTSLKTARMVSLVRDFDYILCKTEIPTVIVECGFLSNSQEAAKLTELTYQQKIAEAISYGIEDYLKEESKGE